MVDAVFEHGGVLDKFMGDGMLCVFGSLDEAPDHPRRAVMAGLRMKALLAKINGERTMGGMAPIAIGIGIHTDDVIVGNIGSRRPLEYTVIDGGGIGSGLYDRDDEADRCQDVADADALGLGTDLHHGLARVVHLPRELPALGLAARDRLLELADDLLERVAVAVVQDGHPRWG